MLDIKFIIENKDQVQDGLNKKGYAKIINLDELISLHGSINKLKTSSQALAEEKNKLSNSIKSALAEERPAIIAKSKALGEELKGFSICGADYNFYKVLSAYWGAVLIQKGVLSTWRQV